MIVGPQAVSAKVLPPACSVVTDGDTGARKPSYHVGLAVCETDDHIANLGGANAQIRIPGQPGETLAESRFVSFGPSMRRSRKALIVQLKCSIQILHDSLGTSEADLMTCGLTLRFPPPSAHRHCVRFERRVYGWR